MHFSAAFVAAALASGAIAGWHDAKSYSSPANTDNQCSSSQAQGYDWSSLADGDFGSYGSNKFSGFKCSESLGKRDVLTKRTFQNKCITGDVQKQPEIACDTDESMSIKNMQVSAERDTTFECHYTMPDTSVCKSTHSCKAGGSTITNDQCGGATKVTFKPVSGDSESCEIGVHKVEFDCGYGSSSSVSTQISTQSITTKTSTKPVTTSIETTSSTLTSSKPATLSSTTSLPVYEQSSSSTPAVSTSSASASQSSSVAVSSSEATSSTAITSSIPVSEQSSSSSVIASTESSSSAAVTSSIPVYGQPSSSIDVSSSKPVPSSNAAITSSASLTTVTKSSAVPVSSSQVPQCPDVLPSCLNTWISGTGCKDNSDFDCLCKNDDFISKAMQCVGAWGSCEDTSKAASYFQGLCAKYIQDQPALITAYPGVATCSDSSSASVVTSYSTSTVYTTTVETSTTSDSTVVVTKTIPVTTTVCPVTLTATTTPVLAVPSTITVYSTQSVIVTSCAESVTDCPAQSTAVVLSSYAVSTIVTTPAAAPTVPATTSWGCPTTVVTYSSVLTVTSDETSSLTTVQTTITVPQVYVTTATITSGGAVSTVSVGLVAGTPSSVPAYPTGTGAASSGYFPAVGTGASLTASVLPTSSTPATYQGAAAAVKVSGVTGGALAALAALLLL